MPSHLFCNNLCGSLIKFLFSSLFWGSKINLTSMNLNMRGSNSTLDQSFQIKLMLLIWFFQGWIWHSTDKWVNLSNVSNKNAPLKLCNLIWLENKVLIFASLLKVKCTFSFELNLLCKHSKKQHNLLKWYDL